MRTEFHDVHVTLGGYKNDPELWFYIPYNKKQGQYLVRQTENGPYVVDSPDPLSDIDRTGDVDVIHLVEFTVKGTGKEVVVTLTNEFTPDQLKTAEAKRIEKMNEPDSDPE